MQPMDKADHRAATETPIITEISHALATIWLARENNEEASYFYGGTRLIDSSVSDAVATNVLARLMSGESGTKNCLINWAIEDGAFDEFRVHLPPGFMQSRVAGARCLIRPRTRELASQLADPLNPRNSHITTAVLECIGQALNEREPRIKLTPDFGRNAGLADVLHQYTPNVLGIRCDRGGCGGKSSYSVTGVLAAIEQVGGRAAKHGPVTCIGSAGAMGSGVLFHFLGLEVADLAACDLVYDRSGDAAVPRGCAHLQSRSGSFTSECLTRGGVIVPTTVGDELNNSPWNLIPRGSVLFLAHNLALPTGETGIQLARALAENGVLVIPGQVLTLGGALTARLEWYWRQLPSNPEFSKSLAHKVVHRAVSHLTNAMLGIAETAAITPYQAMLRLAAQDRQADQILVRSAAV
jgi:hypothetical protein